MNKTLRKEGPSKLMGQSKFIDDLTFPNMLHGATVRSPVARGILKEIIFKDGIKWEDFTIVTAKDIPGKNVIPMLDVDWPFLVDKQINHPGEAIALIAHKDKYELQKALAHIELKIDEQRPVFTIEDSFARNEIIWGKDNIQKSYLVEKGNPDLVWENAAYIVEGEYETGAQEQLYIEPQGMISIANKDAGVTVWGSMQCPYYVQSGLVSLFGFPTEKVRIIQTETGGAFGGKEDYPTLIAGHAALLAWKSGKPVKIIYARDEDLAVTTKRHPSKTYHKTAVDRDGHILAMDIDYKLDGGAYSTVTPVVLSRGTLHAAGPYKCDNIKIKAYALATNTPPNGAYRGFGAPQSLFALERHIDVIAKHIGMDPIEFRRKNFIKEGDTLATGQVVKEKVDYDALLNLALKKIDYYKKSEQYKKSNEKSSIKKGIGISCFMHGGGFTGSGEKYLASIVGLVADREGNIKVLSGSTEMGQGRHTVFAQIVAENLGIEIDDVITENPDTSIDPNSGPTVASRTTMVVGKLIQDAAIGLRETLISSGYLEKKYSRAQFKAACNDFIEDFGLLKSYKQYEHPDHIKWDDATYKGDAYPTYAWAVYAADVEVDTITYQSKVEKFVAVQEVGRVMNPKLAEGQIEGGIAQAIGYAIYEDVQFKQGKMFNNRLTNYIIPTSQDIPEINVYFEEWSKNYGPKGAKGIGELPMDGPAPAVINGIHNALNVSFNKIPLMPEHVMSKMEGNHGK